MKDSKYKVVIIILLVVIVCFGGYIVYDAINDKNNQIKDNEVNENNKNNVQENQVVSYDLKKAEELVDNYYFGETGWVNGFISLPNEQMDDIEQSIAEKAKLYVAMLISKKKQISCSEAKKVIDFVSGDVCKPTFNTIEYDELNEKYRKLFGSSEQVSKKAFQYAGEAYEYDEANDRFVEGIFHGGIAAPVNEEVNFYTVKNAQIKSNKLIINVGYCDVVLSEDKGVFEIANGSKVELKNILKENLKQEIMAKYKEQLKIKTFTFELDNGNYVLRNIEG